MKRIFTFGLIVFCILGYAQDNDRKDVKSVVDQFINAVNTKNIDQIKCILDRNVGFMTVFYDGAKSILGAEDIDMFYTNIDITDTTKTVFLNYKISVSNVLATVWTDYLYYKADKLNQCGEYAFQLFKDNKGWKIIQVTDSRKPKGNCSLQNANSKFQRKAELIDFLDNWHKNAAKSDMKNYFNSISNDGIYIGTDPNEYWTKDEFFKWSEPYFKSGNTWSFDVLERNIYFSDDEDIAWFDEKLQTGMGICHASGVAELYAVGWKIKHYHLSVTIPNEKMNDFIQLSIPQKD